MKIKSLFASALCLAMLASCSQDVVEPNQGDEAKGDAYVALKLSFGNDGPISRTGGVEDTGEKYLADGESNIDTYAMYIFDAAGKLETFAHGTIQTSGTEKFTKGVNCKEGAKDIFVMLNGALPGEYVGTPQSPAQLTITQFKQHAYNIMSTEGNPTKLKNGNKLLMLGHTTSPVTAFAKSASEAENNPFTINVTRCAGKVAVVANSINSDAIEASVVGMKWLLCNRNIYLETCRHDWRGSYLCTSTDFGQIAPLAVTENDAKEVTSIMCGTDNMIEVKTATTKNMADWQYCSENVNNSADYSAFLAGTTTEVPNAISCAKSGNTTYALVEVTLKPAKFTVMNGSNYSFENNTATEAGDYWMLATQDTKTGRTAAVIDNTTKKPFYFASSEAATAFKTDSKVPCGNAVPVCYKGGKNYYRTNISTPYVKANEADTKSDWTKEEEYKKYSIQRGRAYIVNLDKIMGVGSAKPQDVNPENGDTKLTFDTFLAAHVTIANWFGITSNVNLGE